MNKQTTRSWLIISASVAVVLLATCIGMTLLVSGPLLREYEDNWKGTNSFNDPAKVVVTKQNGDRIIEALHRYHERHSAYPPRLDDLVPEFMDAIPKPTAGSGEWEYSGRSTSFSLAFGIGRNMYPVYYRINDSDWHLDS